MERDPAAEWEIDPAEYDPASPDAEKFRFLLRYAILAPSSHNTQPWLFRIAGDRLSILADRTRCLPVVDPHDRALVISCGGALGVLRTAMRRFGHAGEIELLPDGGKGDLLAHVRLGPPHRPSERERSRFAAITRRRSTRFPFEDRPLPPGLDDELRQLAAAGDVEIALACDPTARASIAALVAEGDRIQFSNASFRRELASWVHSRCAVSRDGMSAANFGMPDVLSGVGALVIRTFDLGDGVAAKDDAIASGSAALIVVASATDRPRDWLTTGMAHVDLLLAIAAAGMTCAYLNEPIEVDALRPRLKAVAGIRGVPQLLLRVGYGPEIPPSVRRPVGHVLID